MSALSQRIQRIERLERDKTQRPPPAHRREWVADNLTGARLYCPDDLRPTLFARLVFDQPKKTMHQPTERVLVRRCRSHLRVRHQLQQPDLCRYGLATEIPDTPIEHRLGAV